jgi:hypothetical protein
MIANLIIATGAGLAARGDDQLLVSPARPALTIARLPVTANEWARMRETPFGDPARFAAPGEAIPVAALLLWEDTVAAAGECINGRATLLLASASPLAFVVRIEPDDGSEPLDLPIDGVPVVATLCPHHEIPGWESVIPAMPYAMPPSLEPLVRAAHAARVPIGAEPIVVDRQYAGYSLHLGGRRVDVTGPAGFVFPAQLAARGVDARAVHDQIKRQLDRDEPSDVVTDFEHRYLASALLATRYRKLRDA